MLFSSINTLATFFIKLTFFFKDIKQRVQGADLPER
jgi:hypothetical protein